MSDIRLHIPEDMPLDSLASEARCYLGAGLAAMQSWIDEHTDAPGADESIWSAIYTLRHSLQMVTALDDRLDMAAIKQGAAVRDKAGDAGGGEPAPKGAKKGGARPRLTLAGQA